MFNYSRPLMVGAIPARIVFGARPQAVGRTDGLPAVIVKRMRMTGWCSSSQVELIGESPGLLQIDGLVAAVLVELGTPDLVRALMLGWTEADGGSQPHVEITHCF